MSDEDEEVAPLLNALTATQSARVLEEVGRVTAAELWDLHVLKLWRAPSDMPTPGSDDEAELAEQTETHLLGVLEDEGLLLVRATADSAEGAPLLRRLRAFVLALLRKGHNAAQVHASARAMADSLPSLQTDPERAFAFAPTVPETCEAPVKEAIAEAVVQALGLGAADPLLGLLASPMALQISAAEMEDESEVDEGGDIGDTSDEEDDEDGDEDEEEDEEASDEEASDEGEEEEPEAGGSPPPKRRKE